MWFSGIIIYGLILTTFGEAEIGSVSIKSLQTSVQDTYTDHSVNMQSIIAIS